MGRAAKNLHRQMLNGKDTSDYRGMPQPKKAANDVTSVASKKLQAEQDDNTIAKTDSARLTNDLLIPGDNYTKAKDRQSKRAPEVTATDKGDVQDIVRNLSKQPTPAEAQDNFDKDYKKAAGGTQYPKKKDIIPASGEDEILTSTSMAMDAGKYKTKKK
jgi:hypothetical protein